MSEFEGQVIKCKAAVAHGHKQKVKIETINVAAPGAGEVRIKMTASSLCHTDAFCLSGGDPDQPFPIVLGHEGAGVVESVGKDVKSVAVGDHVIPCFIPLCRECEFCTSPLKTNLCKMLPVSKAGLPYDKKTSYSLDGMLMNTTVHRFMGVGTFSEYIVVPEYSVTKIDSSAPLDKVCLLGCGIPTGYGAAVNTAKVTKGSTVGIWGLGTIGLAAAMGAKAMGAKTIIGFDPSEYKCEQAKKFGVDMTFNPKDYSGEKAMMKLLADKFNEGFDFTFEATGEVDAMKQAFEAAHIGWGTSILIGVSPAKDIIEVHPRDLLSGKKWQGTSFGDYKTRDDIPKLVKKYMAGDIKVDEFITHHFGIDGINDALELMDKHQSLRAVFHFN